MENVHAPPTGLISRNSFFTPLLISIMGIGLTSIAILTFHLLVVRYCMRQAARRALLQQMAGAAQPPTGVDQKTLLTIPVIAHDSGVDPSECAVCLGDVEKGDLVRLLPNCNHTFHVKCIDEWFVSHTNCPVCRLPVVATADEDDDDDVDGQSRCTDCRSPAEASAPDSDDRGDIGAVAFARGGDGVFGEETKPCRLLRHCASSVLPREAAKGKFLGMELKRSLSTGQSIYVTVVDLTRESGRDSSSHSSLSIGKAFREQSVRRFQRVSSRVRRSLSRMWAGQHGEILPY